MGILWGFLHELELVLHAVQLRLLSAPIPQASSEQTGIWGTGDLPVFHPLLYQLSLTSNPLIHAIASLPNIHFPSWVLTGWTRRKFFGRDVILGSLKIQHVFVHCLTCDNQIKIFCFLTLFSQWEWISATVYTSFGLDLLALIMASSDTPSHTSVSLGLCPKLAKSQALDSCQLISQKR